jgi:hypothetical protein
MASCDINKKILKFENLLEQYYKVEQEMQDLIDEYNKSCNTLIYKELWKPIEGYDDHYISSYGRVKNVKTDRILAPRAHSAGYLSVGLYKNRKVRNLYIHRLVAQAFLLNPENRSSVDHADGEPKNNNMLNLRWASHTENMQNKTMYKNNVCGFKGIHKHGRRYRAQIMNKGKRTHIGVFTTKEEASEAYEAKAKELFGEFYKAPITIA